MGHVLIAPHNILATALRRYQAPAYCPFSPQQQQYLIAKSLTKKTLFFLLVHCTTTTYTIRFVSTVGDVGGLAGHTSFGRIVGKAVADLITMQHHRKPSIQTRDRHHCCQTRLRA
jgi:hypothetical protein